jgi:hypothetical protein
MIVLRRPLESAPSARGQSASDLIEGALTSRAKGASFFAVKGVVVPTADPRPPTPAVYAGLS